MQFSSWLWDTRPSPWGYSRVCGSLPNQCTFLLNFLLHFVGKAFNLNPQSIMWAMLWEYGVSGCWPFTPCTTNLVHIAGSKLDQFLKFDSAHTTPPDLSAVPENTTIYRKCSLKIKPYLCLCTEPMTAPSIFPSVAFTTCRGMGRK